MVLSLLIHLYLPFLDRDIPRYFVVVLCILSSCYKCIRAETLGLS